MWRLLFLLPFSGVVPGQVTTLSRPELNYQVPQKAYVFIERGDVTMGIVNIEAVDDHVLRVHRAGYSGVARLAHRRRPENLLVPAYSGLNFEFIHDGTTHETALLFEPRRAPMELGDIGPHTVELYQAPRPF